MRTKPTGIAELVGEDLLYPRAVRATPPDGHTSARPVHVPGRGGCHARSRPTLGPDTHFPEGPHPLPKTHFRFKRINPAP